jgi:DnaK suppressor protein
VKASAKAKTKTAAKSAAKAAKPAPKTNAPKAGKAVAKKAPAKPVAKKPAAKKPAAKPVAKKSAAKPAAKKPVAKKPAAKPAAKKPVPKKPAAKPVTKKPVAKPTLKKPVAKPVAKKVEVKKPVAKANSAKPVAVAKPKPVAAAPSTPVAKAAAVSAPVIEVRKMTGRAAKAAAGVPPPPSTIPFSNPAKASFGPATEDRMPALVPVIPKKDAKLANNWKSKAVEQLSDAEVLAMSDDEYMNDTQMAFFRLKLQGLKRDILANAGETTEHLREDTVIVPDPADRATIEEEHALELRTRDRERKLLKKIEQSIQRIDMGDYGYCDETGEPIGVARLLARPTATLSLEAQQRRELKQKMFGD